MCFLRTSSENGVGTFVLLNLNSQNGGFGRSERQTEGLTNLLEILSFICQFSC